MYNYSITYKVLLWLIIGALMGWMLNSLLVAKANGVKTEANGKNEFNEIRIVGDDGSLCMTISGVSTTSVEGHKIVTSAIRFYGSDGKVSHTIAVDLGGKLYIRNNQMDGEWGIFEPESKITSNMQ